MPTLNRVAPVKAAPAGQVKVEDRAVVAARAKADVAAR